ncbi:ATP-dependent DNA helicase RuvA [Gemmata sp. G18]|uniref:Holliday junction branch migration complex subunit RuvA n=1 Tax=Gemmata palustris TaxID=2822762 RepID=A0ABS5BYF5_9BACT|nr:Holliday junction branch migration protein RuvA [Gemmata palustris]MBP3958771.1 ATP-dependent DNA helicase RuvA [Gemmata palustris]
MITKMTGLLTRVLDDEVRLQIGAFEYQVMVSEAVRRQIQLRVGQEVAFHIMEYLEGNSVGSRFVPRRIGFITEAELEFFELFCTVEKIGVKKALKAMAFPIKTIADAISRQDSKWLSSLPGVGPTTAEQIVTTLKRKVTKFAMINSPTPAAETAAPDAVVEKKGKGSKKASEAEPPATEPLVTAADGQLIEDIYLALMGLGLNPIEARAKLDDLLMSGKPFRSLQDAFAIIFTPQKG